jgi:small-conductance mechanosensitive channel
MDDLRTAITDVMSSTLDRAVRFLPDLLGALALLAIGWVLGRILRTLVARAVLLLDAVLARVLRGPGPERARLADAAEGLGTAVFWVVVLFFVTAATQVLGLELFTSWLGRFLDYLPTLAAGVLIVIAGYLLSVFVRDLVTATATGIEPAPRRALGRVVQAAIFVTALLVGADQIGIRVTFLAVVVAILAATLLGGVAVAVSLGARSYVANLIGAHYLRQAFEVGQRIRVAGHEGRIVELTPLSVVIETHDGRVTLPARLYHEEPIVLVAGVDADG